MQQPRQLYGLGSLVKSIGKTIKKVVKSPVGKGLLLAGGLGLAGMGPFSGLARTGVGQALFGGATRFLPGATAAMKGAATTSPGLFGMAKNFLGSTAGKFAVGGALTSILAASGMSPEEIEETKRDPAKLKIYLRDYYSKTNPDASSEEVEEFVTTNTSEYAVGGRVGFRAGTPRTRNVDTMSRSSLTKALNAMEIPETYSRDFDDNQIRELLIKFAPDLYTSEYATGGRVGLEGGTNEDFQKYLKGKEEFDKKQNAEQLYREYLENKRREKVAVQKTMAANGGLMPTGIMRANKAGTIERDYRETGGFVPVGIKEKADDVPAMLSKNEFVMTADAVRGIGNGNIEKGAQRLYDQMKQAEKRVV